MSTETDAFDLLFKKYGEMYSVDAMFLKAQIRQESNFDPFAVSPHGAKGIAQFMDSTFNEWSTKLGLHNASPFNPEDAIHVQAAYMADLHKQWDDTAKTLAAYNWGTGHLQWLLAHLKDIVHWLTFTPTETQRYVAAIMEFWQEYRIS